CSLDVEVQGLGEWYMEILPDGPENWAFDRFTDKGGYYSQLFHVKTPGELSVLKFEIGNQQLHEGVQLPEEAPAPNTLRILFYENSDTPTREITVQVNAKN
ncbi:MAG: hypothetical protein J6T19_08855, partial [Paludibacteraceae bacterium]|nr:hypothetical protein [Paludibacteraceae bacterium]